MTVTTRRTFPSCLLALPFLAVLLLATAWPAGRVRAAGADDASEDGPRFLRVVESDDGVVALEIAVTRFESDQENRPSVTLVGVAHIGEPAYYDALQQRLNSFDVVLYESVMPPGVKGRLGDSTEARVDYTRAAMTFVWSQVLQYKQARQQFPASLDAVREYIAGGDSRYAQWFDDALTDGWGRPLHFECEGSVGDADDDAHRNCTLLSYGADGEPGGEGPAQDISSSDPQIAAQAEFYVSAGEENLQGQLASALDMEFQLDAIDYNQPGWVCSDMTIDELNAAMAERGIDFSVMGGTLAGSSLPGKVVKVLLRLMSVMDAMMDGAITDLFKITLIEMLGDERIMETSMDQFGRGFGEVIIGERNQVVVDDLSDVIEAHSGDDSIAVFYGAGHLTDFEQRLEQQLGYAPAETQWLSAMTVDLQQSAVSEAQLRQMRVMIRRAIYQSMARSRK